MCLKGDDILEVSLLKAADNEQGTSLTLAEEATILGENPTPQEAQGTTIYPPGHPEETPETKGHSQIKQTLRMHSSRYHFHVQDLACLPSCLTHLPLKDAVPPSQHSWRNLVGYNLSGLHGNNYGQKYPNG